MHANMTPITQLSKVTWPVPTAGAPTITKTAAFVGDDGSGEAPYVQYTVSFYVPDTCYNQPVYLDDHGFVDVYGSFGDAGNTARRFFFNVPGSPVLSVYSDALGERTLTRNVDYSLIDQVNNNGYSAYLAPDKWYLFFIGDTTGIAWPDLGPSSLWPFQDDTWLTFSYNLPLDEIVTDGHGHSMTLKEALQWTQGANPSDFQNWVTGNNPITNVSANVSIDWPIFKTGTVSGDTITYQVRLAATQFGDNFLNYADVFTDVFDPHLEYVPFSFRLWKYGAGYTYYGPYQMAGGVFTDLLSESISGNTMSFDFLNMPHIDWDTSLNQAVYSSDSTLLSDTPPLTDSFYYLEYRMRLKPGAPQGQLTVNNNVSINGFTNQFATQINTSGAASADLAVTKTGAPASVQPGDLLTYTVTTVNNGPDDAQDVTVNDSMPAVLNGAQFSVNGGVSWQPWNGSYTHGTLVSGASFILLLRGTVSAGATGNISNTAVVSSTTPDPNLNNNTAVTTAPVAGNEADLSVVKTACPLSAAPCGRVTYTMVVSNFGPDEAVDVTLTDLIPSELCKVRYSLDGQSWCQWSPWLNDLLLGNLPPNASVTVLIRGLVHRYAAVDMTNTVTVTSATPDPNPNNNHFTVSTKIRRRRR